MIRYKSCKIAYMVHSAVLDLKRGRKLQVVIAICFSLGMLLPMLCLGNINVLIRKFPTIKVKDSSNTLIVSVADGYVSPSEIQYALIKKGIEFDNYSISSYSQSLVEFNNHSNYLHVYSVMDTYFDFENVQLLEGSLNIFDGKECCLIDESLQEEYMGLSVGETITISGRTYVVKGIISALNIKSVIIPIGYVGGREPADMVLDELYIHAPCNLQNIDLVSEALRSIGLSVSSIFNGDQAFNIILRLCIQKSAVILFLGFVAFLFAAINISLILMGKVTQDKRIAGIRMALGASPNQILLGLATENLLCFCGAFILDFGLIRLAMYTCPKELQLIMDAKVYLFSFLFGVLMVFAITIISTWWLRKQNLVTLIERIS